MRKNIFRPVDFWKSAIMTMPENSFFELIRSIFGKIKTPFKKQQLINDLEIFLLREDIQKTIAGYIDENDAKIIAAVALFGEPVSGELESFFSGEFSYVQLQDMIVNLEERFILYRFSEENKNRLALNPVLEQVLQPVTADISLLFPVVPVSSSSDNGTVSSQTTGLNDLVLAGLFSFVSQWESFYRSEGVIRKQIVEAGKNIFPNLDLESMLGSLQVLGLFYIEGDRLIPEKRLFNDFGLLSARERMEHCAAALLVYHEMKSSAPQTGYSGYSRTAGINERTEILPPLFRGRIRELTIFIHDFLDSLDINFLYTEKTLFRLAEILKARKNVTVSGKLLEVLEKTGLILTVPAQYKQISGIVRNSSEKQEGPFITIDSGSSVLVYPEINYADLIGLAAFMNINEAGAVVRFELDRDSSVRAFDSGTTADEIIGLLKRLSGGKAGDSFFWNLKDWEKRHGEIALKKGIILTLSEDRRYLTETMPLSALIEETLTPGIYLLSENAMEDASDALHAAGIDIIARVNRHKSGVRHHSYFSPLVNDNSCHFHITSQPAAPAKSGGSDLEHFHEILEKIQLDKTIKTELSARIDRRLILCEAQLKDADVRYEKLEARLLDYAGKQNIAKQAIAQRSPLEIELQSGKRIFGIPKTLEKEGNELVLVITPDNEKEVLRTPLAKIKLLRRIKKSIFS